MDSPQEQPFRFLDLPRELRDNVYDHLIIGGETTLHKPNIALSVVGQNYLPTNALLVNRQTNSEIVRRGGLYTPTLSLTDHSEFGFDLAPSLILPRQTKLIKLHLFAGCGDSNCRHDDAYMLCKLGLCIMDHPSWIEDWMLSAAEIRNYAIEAEIYLGAETAPGYFQPDIIEGTQAPCQRADFVELPGLRKIQVYTGTDKSRDTSCFAEKNYFTTWTIELDGDRSRIQRTQMTPPILLNHEHRFCKNLMHRECSPAPGRA